MAATAVIVNEFGEIGLDHLLVERSTEDVVPQQAVNNNTAGGGLLCAVCGVPAFLGYANDLKDPVLR
jgi:hypothetical protein